MLYCLQLCKCTDSNKTNKDPTLGTFVYYIFFLLFFYNQKTNNMYVYLHFFLLYFYSEKMPWHNTLHII